MLRALPQAGFDVVRSSELLPAADDRDVLGLAVKEGRVLLTEDADFGDLAVRFEIETHGVVRVALKPMAKSDANIRVVVALTGLGGKVVNAVTVIEPSRVRLRPIAPKSNS
jgi:predicted nuclease of predicted toxin-antitoxin system